MIPIERHAEPQNFNLDVRKKGINYLMSKGIQLDTEAPLNTFFKPYWRKYKSTLYECYKGYCAYTCFHIHEMTGSSAIEHILPKQKFPRLAYEWSNYCLACACINSKKGQQIGLLNPFDVSENLFFLILATGFITTNEQHPLSQLAQKTIDCLDLNNEKWYTARQKCMFKYIENRNNGLSVEIAEKRLKEDTIFVWSEAKRQGYLI